MIFCLIIFPNIVQKNNQLPPVENGVGKAGNTKQLNDMESQPEFDPWALPELQDNGPKWEGNCH